MAVPRSRRQQGIAPIHVFAAAFVVGAAGYYPLVLILASLPVGRVLFHVLLPGTLLTGLVIDLLAHWPGLVKALIAMALNGLVYGLVATAVLVTLRAVRYRR